MNRVQKKCLIVSGGIHLLLAFILIVGPAFLSSSEQPQSMELLPWIPALASDGPTGGGGQNMRPPSPDKEDSQPAVQVPTPPQPQPQPVVTQPPPQPQPKPEVVKAPTPDAPKIVKPSVDPVETVKPPKHSVVVNTDLITTSKKDDQAAKDTAAKRAADKAAKQAADAQRQMAAAFSKATHSLKGGFAGGTDIKFNAGFGGSGPAYANWLQIVQTIYYSDWSQRAPLGVSDDTLACVASVTISRDGSVLSSRITKTSGNSSVDRSIQSTLDHVRFTRPFPDTSKEEQTVLEIYFNLKAVKQLIG